MQEQYVKCLKEELKYKYEQIAEKYDITTIYIGGGTPSYIESKYIKELLEIIQEKNENAEITIEVNPGTVTEQKLVDYKEAGVNRLSIGLQSCNNELLKKIGRIHTYEQFLETYKLSRKVGFKNINVDLMLGLPNQTIDDLKNSLENVMELHPEHISVYSLILEEGTRLFEHANAGTLELPEENIERMMYWYVKNTLELHEYEHYEISNFSKKGWYSKHNVNCWKQKEYIGVGLAASSYMNKIRFSNISDLRGYINNIENEEYEKNKIIEEVQDKETEQKEFILLGLRQIKGVSIQEFKNKFGVNPIYLYKNEFNKLVAEELIDIDRDIIKLTNKGLDLANQVWQEFV